MDTFTSSNPVVSHLRRYAVDSKKVSALAAFVTARLRVADHGVAVTFVGTKRMQRLNHEFRGKLGSTDVLSFPQVSWVPPRSVRRQPEPLARSQRVPPKLLGDLVISLPDAEKNARSIGQALDREVCFLMVHGILHLAGHDHLAPPETRRMVKAQRQLIELLRGKGRLPMWHRCVRLKARTP